MISQTILLLALMLVSVSCKKSGGSSSEEAPSPRVTTVTGDGPAVVPYPSEPEAPGDESLPTTPPPVVSTLPAQALSFRANVKLYEFTTAQEDKYNEAIKIVKKVVSTEEFKSRVLNFQFNGIKQFANNNGLTNAQIYQSILDAAEKLKPAKNNTMDLGVKLYYEDSTVIGWTSPSITHINVNTKFFNGFEYNEVASNLFHEWLHKVGYVHDANVTPQRPYSVPYAIGYLIRDIGADFL